MKKSELISLIKEVITEVYNQTNESQVMGLGVAESSPPDFPPSLEKKLLAQYKDNPEKAYATMWTIHNKKNEGDKRVTEMLDKWQQQEIKRANEAVGEQVDTVDASGTLPPNPNDPHNVESARLAAAKKKEADALGKIRKVDADVAKLAQQNFSKQKRWDYDKQQNQRKLNQATKDEKKAEEDLTKKVNKI